MQYPLPPLTSTYLRHCVALASAAFILPLVLPLSYAQTLPSAQPGAGAAGVSGGGFPKADEPLAPGFSPTLNSPAMQPTPASTKLPITGFRFVGNTLFSGPELLAQLGLVLPEDGVTFADLSQAVDRVSRFYRTQGYVVARAYVPQQGSKDGVIQINILEGVHTRRTLANSSAVKTERIQKTIQEALCGNEKPNCEGSFVTDAGNERTLRLLNDMPGVLAIGTLEPGLAVGSSSLNMTARPSQLPTTSYGIDNYGSKATGIYRVSAARDFNNLRGEGDVLSLSGAISKTHIWSGSLGYSLLAGYTGTRVGFSYGHGQYLLGDSFASLNAHGESDSLGIFASHPVIRHRDGNLTLRGAVDYRSLRDSIEAAGFNFHKRNTTYTLQAMGDRVDGAFGGGYNTFNVALSSGNLRLLDADSQARDSTPKTAGAYSKTSFNFTRQQAIVGAFTVYVAAAGQIASKNLDGSEKIGLGGPGGVRGYAAGEASGDKGGVVNLELRYTKPLALSNKAPSGSPANGATTLTYSVFVDRGWVQTNAQPWAGAGAVNTQARTSIGLGVLLIKPFDYSLRALWATHGTSAGQASTANPGSKSQFWLQASKSI